MPQKTYSISAKMGKTYEIDAQAGNHKIKIDQPQPVGNDIAPNPLDYFLMSLAGCICTIFKTIAAQKKIELNAVEVAIDGKIDTDFLLGMTTQGRAGFYEITATIKIDAPITQAEKEQLAKEVEERCPVSENIANALKINLNIS